MTALAAGSAVKRVLVVEDEDDIAALVSFQLAREGYHVDTARSGSAALSALQRRTPDLVVLDRMLPDVSGDDVLRAIRGDSATRGLPVLVLSAKREDEERVAGLELGADDYLTKPFSLRELVLRVDAILRRSRSELQHAKGGGRILRSGPLKVDLGALRVTLNGEEVQLTPTEFRLLQTLLGRIGRTQSRRQLLVDAWQLAPRAADRIHTRTVDMHVRRLRAKLGPVGYRIETVRGFGYRFRRDGG